MLTTLRWLFANQSVLAKCLRTFLFCVISVGLFLYFVAIPNRWLALEQIGPEIDELFSIFMAAFVGFGVAGLRYLMMTTRDMRNMTLRQDELIANEKVVRIAALVHLPDETSNPLKAIGGKLFLTTHRVVFKAHIGQSRQYQVDIPLSEIFAVGIYPLGWLAEYGVRIQRHDGSNELL